MNIGELAKRTGLTHSRIRFYESIGLLQTVDRKANGYRTYPADAVNVLDMITTAQKAGFSLDEIRALMPGASDTWQHGELMNALRSKVADIEALEKRLAESKAQLVAVITDIEAKPNDISCEANARRVISRILEAGASLPTVISDNVKVKRRQLSGAS